MKKLLICLLLIPNLSWSESYVCAFKCFIGDDICQTTYTRKNNIFIDDWNHEFRFVEDQNSLAMSNIIVESDGSVIFSVIIDKKTLEFTKSTTQLARDWGGTGHEDGTCSLVK